MDTIKRITDLAKERGWSINYLALEAGLTQSTLATMLQRNTPPKLETLEKLCEAFNITLAQFFCDEENMELVTDEEKEMLMLFRKLNKEKQKAFIKILK